MQIPHSNEDGAKSVLGRYISPGHFVYNVQFLQGVRFSARSVISTPDSLRDLASLVGEAGSLFFFGKTSSADSHAYPARHSGFDETDF